MKNGEHKKHLGGIEAKNDAQENPSKTNTKPEKHGFLKTIAFSHNVPTITSPATKYIRESLAPLDGLVWLAICATSLLLLMDVLLGTQIAPLRKANNPPTAITILLLCPILTFLAMIMLRMAPFSSSIISSYTRSVLLVLFFAVLNF